ncbi:MAG: prolyl oligopeptidase family serine peptidase [Anaerovoracaceae bacterium]
MKKKTAICIALTFAIAICVGCGKDEQIDTKDIVLQNDLGTYTSAQIVMPKEFDGKMPLVTIGHGYKGTMNSGGAKELAQRLAAEGIATIRMNYNHYNTKDMSETTNRYTLNTMIKDQLLCIDYMCKNYSIDNEKIGLYARSMGGRAAMTMANENIGGYNYKALALVAPAGNKDAMEYYMGGKDKWTNMKEQAKKNGFILHQGIELTEEWFTEFEEYNPAANGYKFNNQVLVIYNTLDNVVTAHTSKECARGYKNVETVQVTTDNGHGYEMSYEDSEIKEELMNKIVDFFKRMSE